MAIVAVPDSPPPDHTQGVPTEPQGLPIELVAKVLQHVPLQNRLQRCALVQRSRCKAAAAATSSIKITCSTQAQLDSTVAWLAKHGQAVTQLIVASSNHPDAESIRLRELPCANLIDLQLSAPVERQNLPAAKPFILHKTLSSTVPSLFSSCTALQRLEIRHCHALVPASLSVENGWPFQDCRPFHALYSVPHLTALALYGVGDTDESQLDLKPVLSLTGLKSLTLSDGGQLGQSLQVGSIFTPGYVQPSRWYPKGMRLFREAAAATSGQASPLAALTDLCIDFKWGNVPQYITWTQQDLTKLTALRHLTVRQCYGFSADLLTGFSQLETLVLDCVDLLQDSDYVMFHNSQPTATLLQALLNMQQLRSLELRGCLHDDNPACFAPAADYSALATSSKLEVLQLTNAVLPEGAWGHVFKKGRQLPKLTQLVVGSPRLFAQQSVPAPGRICGGDIDSIVSCCPHLQRLEIDDHVDVQQLAPLPQLTALTELVACVNLPTSQQKLVLGNQVLPAQVPASTVVERLSHWLSQHGI